METRRKFIAHSTKILTGSFLTVPAVNAFSPDDAQDSEGNEKKLIVGVIGAENSHTAAFGRVFNIEKQFPGVELKYVWGETKEFARQASEKGKIPVIVDEPLEMMGKIDALIVDHRHPKFHLEAATPFIKKGIPTFVDKPFCYRLAEGIEFLKLARKCNTPVTSYSTIAHALPTFDVKKKVSEMGEIKDVVCYGPADLHSKYGGIFFYGVHLVQPLMYIFGNNIERVKVTKNGSYGNAAMVYENGLFITLVFKSLSYGWNIFADTTDGVVELKSDVPKSTPGKANTDIVSMFRTGKEPRSYESILSCVAVLEALEKSVENEKWIDVEKFNI